MYAEAGLQFPFLQGFPQEGAGEIAGAAASAYHHYHQFPCLPLSDGALLSHYHSSLADCVSPLGDMVQTSVISEYDLGAEGDLFKAPEPIIEEPALALDPMKAAMSLMSGQNDAITEAINAANMESIQNDQLLSDVFYNCNDLLEKSAIEESISELLDVKNIPTEQTEEVPNVEKLRLDAEGPMQKSVSIGCLNSMECINGCSNMRPNFLDFQGLDLEAAFGMRRAYSEGDIQNLGNNINTSLGNAGAVHSTLERQLTISDHRSEERREKLSRYMKKKTKRNFGRKIKYACRKALADSQPRVRGRFAKTEECEVSKPNKYM